jgi:hypothetical protein
MSLDVYFQLVECFWGEIRARSAQFEHGTLDEPMKPIGRDFLSCDGSSPVTRPRPFNWAIHLTSGYDITPLIYSFTVIILVLTYL